MIYWRIQTDKGETGYQVMDDDRGNAQIKDDNGNDLVGNFDYTVTDVNPPLPSWAV